MDKRRKPAVHSKPKVRVFLEGRYRKLVRDLPQTIFYCPTCKGRGCERCEGYGKLTRDSVQELIARKVLPRYKARYGKFHGAGREDVDVRMLGTGRPFVYEVVKPKSLCVDLDEIHAAIQAYGRGRIEITPLLPVPRARVAALKETRCAKVYRALVAVEGPLPAAAGCGVAGKEFAVVQRTPLRVVHRRADRERTRVVECRSAEPMTLPPKASAGIDSASQGLALEVCCEHGTYVKEWISGEDGRSTPSLSALLGQTTRCLALDVLEVCGPLPELSGPRAAPTFEDNPAWPAPAPIEPDAWALGGAALSDARSRADDARTDERARRREAEQSEARP